jgi:hypothetical protein
VGGPTASAPPAPAVAALILRTSQHVVSPSGPKVLEHHPPPAPAASPFSRSATPFSQSTVYWSRSSSRLPLARAASSRSALSGLSGCGSVPSSSAGGRHRSAGENSLETENCGALRAGDACGIPRWRVPQQHTRAVSYNCTAGRGVCSLQQTPTTLLLTPYSIPRLGLKSKIVYRCPAPIHDLLLAGWSRFPNVHRLKTKHTGDRRARVSALPSY